MDCPFCKIIVGEAPATFVEKWPDAVAFVPLVPVTPGHVLVVPKVHVGSFTADPSVTGEVMSRAAELASNLGLHAANLITSDGVDATQTVFHMHVHLIPRHPGDWISLPWDVRR